MRSLYTPSVYTCSRPSPTRASQSQCAVSAVLQPPERITRMFSASVMRVICIKHIPATSIIYALPYLVPARPAFDARRNNAVFSTERHDWRSLTPIASHNDNFAAEEILPISAKVLKSLRTSTHDIQPLPTHRHRATCTADGVTMCGSRLVPHDDVGLLYGTRGLGVLADVPKRVVVQVAHRDAEPTVRRHPYTR